MIHFEISFDVPHSIMSSLIMLSFGIWVNMKRNTKHIWLLLSECLKILVAAVMQVLARGHDQLLKICLLKKTG
jgi:hypothetical protein